MIAINEAKVGVRVRCKRERPAKGTWKRYAGKTGTIESVVISQDDVTIHEIHVKLDENSVHAWFQPDELVATR